MSHSFPATLIGILLFVVSPGAVNQPNQQVTAPATETLLGRMADALGGAEKLRAVENISMHGKVEAAGLSGTVDDWQTARGQHRQVVDLGEAYKQTTIFDGTRGWTVDRNNHISDLAGVPLEKEILSSYLGSFSYLIAGRLAGKVSAEGEDASKKYFLLRLEPQGGSEATYFVDKSTFLPFSMEVRSKEGTTTTYFEDYRDVNGVKMPFRYRQVEPNPSNNASVQQESIQVNTTIAAANFTRPAPATPDFRFTNRQRSARMPIGTVGNAIFVQARLNNSTPLWFILDTGASASVVDAVRARALGLKSEGDLAASAPGGSVQVKFTKGVNFILPGVSLMNQSVISSPFPKEIYEMKPNFGGILGYDLISRFVMEIDYLHKTLTLYDAKTYEYKGPGKRVPIVVEGTPFVSGQVKTEGHDPVSGRFEIDTGYDGALSLYGNFVNAHPDLKPAAAGVHSTRQSLAKSSDNSRSRVERFTFGEVSFADVVTDYAAGDEGSDRDVSGLIGNEIFRRFKVTFDYSRQVMFLEPNARVSEPFGANVSGLELELQTKPRRKIMVADVQDESAAAEAGIQRGDQLIAVDNQPTTSFTVDQIDKLLQAEEREFLLTIKRGPKVLKVKLKTKKRI
jgi:hypothetical protein